MLTRHLPPSGSGPRDFLAPELALIRDLDSLVNSHPSRNSIIATRGVLRAIAAAREHGFHALADKATSQLREVK